MTTEEPYAAAWRCERGQARAFIRHREVERAIVAASECSGIPVADIVGRSRSLSVARARAAALVIARRHTLCSSVEIGMAFERHHQSVQRAVARWEHDIELAFLVGRIEQRFYREAS